MQNSKVESHQITDLSILQEVNEFIDDTNWYVMSGNDINLPFFKQFFEQLPAEQQEFLKSELSRRHDRPFPLISKINANGHWPGQNSADVNQIIKSLSIVRQPYGWDDASTASRAPVIYKLFQYINKTLLDNRFTLDGVPEEISGTRHMFYDENYKDMPHWGTGVGPSGSIYDEKFPIEVWTAYANAKTPTTWNFLSSTKRFAGLDNRTISNGAHRDWHGMYGEDESEVDGCYTMVVPVNLTWKYGEGLELILYETIPPGPDTSVHDRRGYGVGKPTHIFPHTPGLVVLYPATTIHTTTAPGTHVNHAVLGKNVVFRIRKKSSI
jgi:hypothetical protein